MRLENYTTVPDATLREIIRFACPPGVSGFDLAVKNSSGGYRGRAYSRGTGYHERAGRCPPYIIVGRWKEQPLRWLKPYKFCDWKSAYLGVTVYSDVEAIVYIVAHELRHLWQERVKRGHRVWGARGQHSERDADAYALHVLREWRRK